MQIIKQLTHFTFIFTIICLTSCLPETSEVWIDKSGSVKIEVTKDVSAMGDLVDLMINKILKDQVSDSTVIFSSQEKMDTIVTLYSLFPDSTKQQIDNPEILKKLKISVNKDLEREIFQTSLIVSYHNKKEQKDILNVLSEIKPLTGDADLNIDSYFNIYKPDLKNGIIRISSSEIDDPSMPSKDDPKFKEMIKAIKDPSSVENPKMAEMYQMVLGGNQKTIVHTPSKVIFTNDKNAQIDGSTVTFKDKVLDLMMGEGIGDRIIKFQ